MKLLTFPEGKEGSKIVAAEIPDRAAPTRRSSGASGCSSRSTTTATS